MMFQLKMVKFDFRGCSCLKYCTAWGKTTLGLRQLEALFLSSGNTSLSFPVLLPHSFYIKHQPKP